MPSEEGDDDPRDITFDFDRQARIGLGEAVFCSGKSPAQIARIAAAVEGRAMPLLLTRMDSPTFAALPGELRAAIDYDAVSRTGIFGPWMPPAGRSRVAVVTAGTSDLPVAREAVRTLAFYGQAALEVHDVGVAGLWRLLRHEESLRQHDVVIVVAGMEGALFSVVGGLVPAAVVAVPTSTGYGVARAGETALHAALASCAPGLVAVNIDNGYGAAAAAIRILNAG